MLTPALVTVRTCADRHVQHYEEVLGTGAARVPLDLSAPLPTPCRFSSAVGRRQDRGSRCTHKGGGHHRWVVLEPPEAPRHLAQEGGS